MAVKKRADDLAQVISAALKDDLDQFVSVSALTEAIAVSSGGYAYVERRKLKGLLEYERGSPAPTLTLLEIAALDIFWRDAGGFPAKLRGRTLAETVSRADVVTAFLPSLPASTDEPERLGYVPVADVRAAAVLRQILLRRNPALQLNLEEIPRSTTEDLLVQKLAQIRKGAVISIGGRTNMMTVHLLKEFFGADRPVDFVPPLPDLGGTMDPHRGSVSRKRCLRITDEELPDHAIICYRRLGQRLDIVIAGDCSLSTIAAAHEIATAPDVIPDVVRTVVVRAEVDKGRTNVVGSRIVERDIPNRPNRATPLAHRLR